METELTIQQVAALTGLSMHTLRYYERIGLLAPGQITQWCQEAGLQVVHYARQTDEHYMLTVQRSNS